MPMTEEAELQNFLKTFNAASLGEGDRQAGANVLTAMAITLANVSRSGCGIVSPGFGRMRAGASMLVSGGLSASLITDKIVSELAIRQNNLTAQLRRLIGDKVADAQKKKLTAMEFPAGPAANASENAIFQLEQRDSLASLEASEQWAEVVTSPPNPRIEDLAERPKILVTASCAKELHKRLCGLHGGRPLVVLGVSRAVEVSALGETCNALLDGTFPNGHGGETASGNLLFTDSTGLLQEILNASSDATTWLSRTLWLVDGSAGPDLPIPSDGKIRVTFDDMTGRFGSALSRAFGARLNNHDAGTTTHKFNLDDAQLRWVAFLKDMECRMPCICGTARGLLATLTFGLLELGRGGAAKSLTFSAAEIEAFARFLVRRMVNAHASMTESAEQERRNLLIRRIFQKLSEGRMNKRDLYRDLSIDAQHCEGLLLEMAANGLVLIVDRECERIEGAKIPGDTSSSLSLKAC